MERGDSISASTNIAALAMEAQREANDLRREELRLIGNNNRTSIIAAIAAAIAAITSIANIAISISLLFNGAHP